MARESKKTRDEKRFGKPERFVDLLADRRIGEEDRPGGDREDIRDAVARSMKVDVQNVSSYAASLKPKSFEPEDFPCCVPPGDPTFMEYKSPLDPRHRIGCLLGGRYFGAPNEMEFVGFLLLEIKGYQCVSMPLGFTWAIDGQGNTSGFALQDSRNAKAMFRYAVPFLLAMSLANCKNTTIEPHEPDPKLNRDRVRHGLRPFVRYHTINIEPMRKVLKTEGGVEANGLKKALHICRGHFARYSEEKPLFGHTSGLVWRPAHTRGAVSQGVVVSDYKVDAPKSAV